MSDYTVDWATHEAEKVLPCCHTSCDKLGRHLKHCRTQLRPPVTIALRASRKQALLDATKDVCGYCAQSVPLEDGPYGNGLGHFVGTLGRTFRGCNAKQIHRRIKEEGL